MRLEIAAPAERELDDAVAWYHAQGVGLDAAFLSAFHSAIRRISANPDLYVEIDPGIRRGLLNRFPYSIIYEQDSATLRILAIAHQHRRPFYWREMPSG